MKKVYKSWIDWAKDNIIDMGVNMYEPSNYLLYKYDIRAKSNLMV